MKNLTLVVTFLQRNLQFTKEITLVKSKLEMRTFQFYILIIKVNK